MIQHIFHMVRLDAVSMHMNLCTSATMQSTLDMAIYNNYFWSGQSVPGFNHTSHHNGHVVMHTNLIIF